MDDTLNNISGTVNSISGAVQALEMGTDTLFILLGAIMVLAMHAGFAFLEVGTVRHKNQVNALVKILADFGVSTIAYFFIGYGIAYGHSFMGTAAELSVNNGYELVKFFFLLTFAAAIPAIVSGGIAERARFYPIMLASFFTVGFLYPIFEGMIWHSTSNEAGEVISYGNFGLQDWFHATFDATFHDFAGSVVVHAFGGWVALIAVIFLGMRHGRLKDNRLVAFAPSNIPFLALGAWILTVGWFGFNVMSAQQIGGIGGLVAVNSLMAMAGGTLAALVAGKNDPGFLHNGPLAGLVAVCAGSDLMHPVGALVTGVIAGIIFVFLFTYMQNRTKIDDVLGVWPLHGICGAWGGIAAGIFGLQALGGMGGVNFWVQLLGTLAGIVIAVVGAVIIYGSLHKITGLRLSQEEEYHGADLSIHKISAENHD